MAKEPVERMLGRAVGKPIHPKRAKELKQEFEKKSQAFLDRLAKETGEERFKSIDYGKLAYSAVWSFFHYVPGRWFEGDYKPLTKRKSHSGSSKFLTSLKEEHIDDLAEIAALFFSFTRTKKPGYARVVPEEQAAGLGKHYWEMDFEDALSVKALRKQYENPPEKRTLLVSGTGMDSIDIIDYWKKQNGRLHLVESDPFVAALLRNYVKINKVKNVKVHEKDVSKMKFKPNTLDYAKLETVFKYIEEPERKRFLKNIFPALKENGLLFISDGIVEDKQIKQLVDKGMKISLTKSRWGNASDILALKQKPGEKGLVLEKMMDAAEDEDA